MDFASGEMPLPLDRQYIVKIDIRILMPILFDLLQQHSVMYRLKPYPDVIQPQDDPMHIQLFDLVWSEFGALELIDLDGSQTLLRFFGPGPAELSDLEKHARAIRQFLSRPAVKIWLYENMGWTAKLFEIFAEELFTHRLNCLQSLQNLLTNKLVLIPYPLSYFEFQPAPQIEISKNQPDSPLSPIRLSQLQQDSPQLQARIPQIFPDNPQQQNGISPIPPENLELETGVDRDIPREHFAEENDEPLTRDDQELLCLWTNGLTAKEIGMRTGRTGKTIANRLSVLRGMYGEERVPLRKKPTWKRLG